MSPFRTAPAAALSLLVASVGFLFPLAASAVPPQVDPEFSSVFEETYLLKLSSATDLEFSPDGSLLLITEKNGKLWVVENFDGDGDSDDLLTQKEAIDIASRMCTNGERGLGGVAFHPQYPDKPYVYLHYNYDKYNDCFNGENKRGTSRGPVNRLSRFILEPDTYELDVSSEQVFLETPRQPVHNHNGGDIAFGKDGMLYATLGDGGTRVWRNDAGVYYSQALDNLFGKVVRFTDDGDIPDDNPYAPSQGHSDAVRCGETEGEAPDPLTKCQEIYANGLRNPFRFAFDPDSDRFFINDVGRSTWEKIVEGKRGGNYGYPTQDGPCVNTKISSSCEPNEYTQNAIHWYKHDDEDGGCITGGAFVSKKYGWPESFRDVYLYSDYALGGIYVITKGKKGCQYPTCKPPVSDYDTKVLSSFEKIVSMQFGPAKKGYALYHVTKGKDGDRRNTEGLYRIAFTGTANRSPIAIIDADVKFGFSPLVVNFLGVASDPDGDDLTYEWDFDGDGEIDYRATNASYKYTTSGTYFASLTVKDGKGGERTTSVRIEVGNTPPTPVITSPAAGTMFAVGDKFVLKGFAVDGEEGELPRKSLVWEVRQHHNAHWHPFLDPTQGNRIELDGAPEPEDFDASTTSYLQVLLTATDSTGLSTTTSRILMPKMVKVKLDTKPSGLRLVAYGDTIITPATIVTWENHEFELEAPETTIECGEPHSFVSWSDGGERIHTYIATASSRSGKSSKVVATFSTSETTIVCPGENFPEDQVSTKGYEAISLQEEENEGGSTPLNSGSKVAIAIAAIVGVGALSLFIFGIRERGRRASGEKDRSVGVENAAVEAKPTEEVGSYSDDDDDEA